MVRWGAAACLMILMMACSPPAQTVALCELGARDFNGQLVRVRAQAISTRHGVLLVDSSCVANQVWLESADQIQTTPEENAFFDAISRNQECHIGEDWVDVTGTIEHGRREHPVLRIATLHGYELNEVPRPDWRLACAQRD